MVNVNGVKLAVHLCCTRESIGDYAAAGIITKLPDGRFDQDDCRARVFKHLRDKAAGRTGNSGADLSAARAKLASVQTEAMQLKTDIANGKYCEVSRAGEILTAEIAGFRENVLAMPGAAADAICTLCGGDAHLRGQIEDALRDSVHELLEDISSGAEIALRSSGYQQWRGRR